MSERKPRTRASFMPTHMAVGKNGVVNFKNRDIICFPNQITQFEDVPYIQLIEYHIDRSVQLQKISQLMSHGWEYFTNRTFSYADVYSLVPTKYSYILPYLNDYHHQINQNWEDSQGVCKPIDAVVDGIVSMYKTFSPAAGILYPKSYSGATDSTYDVPFYLLNTTGTIEDIHHNKAFLERIIKMNLLSKSTAIAIAPPCVYEAFIPGVRFSPVAAIHNIIVENVGTLNDWYNYTVPDAWKVTLQIRELINETRDIFMDGVGGHDIISTSMKTRVARG